VAFTADGKIWRTELDGGDAQILCSAAGRGNVRGIAWTEEGRVITATNSGLLESAQSDVPCPVVLATEGDREARFL
jgi:hypothetical protein